MDTEPRRIITQWTNLAAYGGGAHVLVINGRVIVTLPPIRER
jgi:hypothetical protein